jgi:hypothetical protein
MRARKSAALLLAACVCAASRSCAATPGHGLASRLDRLEKHMLFLHERVAESICGDTTAGKGADTITSSGAWCLRKEGEVLGWPIAPFHFLDTPLAAYIYDKLLVDVGSVLDIGAGSGQVCAPALGSWSGVRPRPARTRAQHPRMRASPGRSPPGMRACCARACATAELHMHARRRAHTRTSAGSTRVCERPHHTPPYPNTSMGFISVHRARDASRAAAALAMVTHWLTHASSPLSPHSTGATSRAATRASRTRRLTER